MAGAHKSSSLQSWIHEENQQQRLSNHVSNNLQILEEDNEGYSSNSNSNNKNNDNKTSNGISVPIMIPSAVDQADSHSSKAWPRSFFSATERSLRRSMEGYISKPSAPVDFGSQGKRQGEILTFSQQTQPISFSPGGWPRSWKSAADQLVPSPAAVSIASSWDRPHSRMQEQEPLLWSEHIEEGKPVREQQYPDSCLQETKKVVELKEEYEIIGTSNLLQTVLNGMNILCGIGMLATPYAVATSGTASTILIIILACICIYTGVLLKRAMDMAGPECISYPDIGAAAFGQYGRIITAIILYGELFACCIETLILGGDNLNELTNHATIFIADSQKFWIIITALILMPLTYIRDLRLISIVSACGFFFSLSVLIIITAFGIQYTGFPYIMDKVIQVQSIPIALALLWSFILVTIVYICTALIGYGAFGTYTAQQITLSLHKFQPDSILSQLAGWVVIVSPFCAFPLLTTPIAQGLEEFLPESIIQNNKKNKIKSLNQQIIFWVATISMRTVIVMLALCIALSVPLFAYFASLVGSIFSTNISYVLPCIYFIRLANLSGVSVKGGNRVACVLIPIIGLIAGGSGAFNSFMAINRALHSSG